jgi:TolB-like protein/Tfp pilus assembly protein PilF
VTAVDPLLADALRERYALEKELGRGGMATVYLAQDLRHHRPVALKVLEPELSVGVGPERFRREIETAARLEHPHILPVLDSGEARGWLWYTMPYVEGESLRQRLNSVGRLPVVEALRLTREAALALDFAHRHGIVHRDVKPENILLSDNQALVADFGIAKALEVAGDERLTGTGAAVGTPTYMSPEQAAGGQVDARSDIYALGSVLYEMLTGEPPFTGRTPQGIIARRFLESAPSVRRLRDAVPTDVEEAVARALAREPADRFQTAAEFARALAGAAAGPLVLTSAPASSGLAAPPATRPSKRPRRRVPAGVTLLALGFLLGLGVLFAWLQAGAGDQGAGNAKLLAVLPFENLGGAEDEYFADGITDEVRGKLAALPGLQVIAGGSSSEYRRTTKPPQQIARELGVQYLLTGRVRWEKGPGGQSRVRVSPELVEVRPRAMPTTKWQEPLEAPLTDVFRVQADIAGRVAEALNVALGADARARLGERPAANLPAYDAYLKGEEISGDMASNPNPVMLRRALPYYEQAVALDSGFVEAWARLSLAHSLIYMNGTPLPAEAEAARGAAERALALAPGRAEGRLALGNYYGYVLHENQRALEQYALGLRIAPNNAELLIHSGFAERDLGQWEAALAHFRQAQKLNPRVAVTAVGLSWTLVWFRQYAQALKAAEQGLALDPANLHLLRTKAMIYLAQGDLAGARAVLRSAPKEVEPVDLVAHMANYYDLFWVLEEEQQLLLLRLPPTAFYDDRFAWGIVLAQTYALRGEQAKVRAYADSARVAVEAQLRDAPQDAQRHVFHGLLLAYLGRKAEAVVEAERGVALLPVSKDAYTGPYLQHQLVRIYLLVGEPDKALDRLESLLRIPYYLSADWLKIDPTFAPLRGYPRFQRLLEEGGPGVPDRHAKTPSLPAAASGSSSDRM